jgi:DNA-directed RNA polymerase subunit RPC12/RpoP
MKMYCTECGTPLEYTSAKPKFCSNCGYNFATKAKASVGQSPNPPPIDNENPELDEYDVREIDPRIYAMEGLDVEVSNTERKPLTFGDMFPNNETQKEKKKQS